MNKIITSCVKSKGTYSNALKHYYDYLLDLYKDSTISCQEFIEHILVIVSKAAKLPAKIRFINAVKMHTTKEAAWVHIQRVINKGYKTPAKKGFYENHYTLRA